MLVKVRNKATGQVIEVTEEHARGVLLIRNKWEMIKDLTVFQQAEIEGIDVAALKIKWAEEHKNMRGLSMYIKNELLGGRDQYNAWLAEHELEDK